MAVIKVPRDFRKIQDAVNNAASGDVILVDKGIYHETVVITRSNIRIYANHQQYAVLDGRNLLASAFMLNKVSGVVIAGFKIKNFIENGIAVNLGNNNRIINNQIHDVGGSGIELLQSSGNLVWQNNIKRTGAEGIQVGPQRSVGNSIVQNVIQFATNDGNDVYSFADANNALVGNYLSNNGDNGIEVFGPNTLVLNNQIFNNGGSGVFAAGGGVNAVILNNRIKMNVSDGIHIGPPSINNFISMNEIAKNSSIDTEETAGIHVFSKFNFIEQNSIKKNRDIGLELIGNNNTAIFNELQANKPYDIVNTGKNNNLLFNECECSNPPSLCFND